jgi:hypothetical protein
MTELNCYQKIIQYLDLLDNEEATGIFQHCTKLYPAATDDDCRRMIGMLALLFPEKDYTKLVNHIFLDKCNLTRKEKFINFMKNLIGK